MDKYLLASMSKLDKSVDVQVLTAKNYHHWGKNVAQKPKMILQLLNEGKDNIVFVDADATIESYPQLFHDIPDEYDIAFHTLHWDTWYNRPKDKTVELLSGTMFFRNRQIVKDLCVEWYAKAEDGNRWEQQILSSIISKYPLKIYPLPISYCYIKTLPRGQEPYVKIELPVIVHHQVSRILKRRGNL
jgi:hypothetical protein